MYDSVAQFPLRTTFGNTAQIAATLHSIDIWKLRMKHLQYLHVENDIRMLARPHPKKWKDIGLFFYGMSRTHIPKFTIVS